jgi:LPXTG-motif cell wall-anchored protein
MTRIARCAATAGLVFVASLSMGGGVASAACGDYGQPSCVPSGDPGGSGGGTGTSGAGGGGTTADGSGGGSGLPFTGSDVTDIALLGGALVLAGGASFTLSRRRAKVSV